MPASWTAENSRRQWRRSLLDNASSQSGLSTRLDACSAAKPSPASISFDGSNFDGCVRGLRRDGLWPVIGPCKLSLARLRSPIRPPPAHHLQTPPSDPDPYP